MAGTTGKPWIINKRSDGSVWMSDWVPVLSALSILSNTITTTSATASVTVSVARGQIFIVVTSSAVVPTIAQIKAGQDHNSAAALFASSTAALATGITQLPVVGLSGATTKYVYMVHNANGYDSGVVNTSFLLAASSAYTTYSAALSATKIPGWFNLRDADPAIAAIPLEASATIRQNGPLVPANVATFELADNYLARVVFVETANDSPVQPDPVSVSRFQDNAESLTVDMGVDVAAIAVGNFMTMEISCVGLLSVTPETQGWTARGSITPGSTSPKMYLFSKACAVSEPNVLLTHSGGRICAIVKVWRNVNLTTPFDQAAVFDTPVDGVTSPGVTPTQNNCSIVSVHADGYLPTYTSPPAGFALQSEGIIYLVFWVGSAYKKQTTAAATGAISWGISISGGDHASMTYVLRGAATGVLKYGFDVPLLHHSPTQGDRTVNLRVNP
jgi:hypothetical protein